MALDESLECQKVLTITFCLVCDAMKFLTELLHLFLRLAKRIDIKVTQQLTVEIFVESILLEFGHRGLVPFKLHYLV